MNPRNAFLAIAVAAMALTSGSASAVDFHGYFRSGIGSNSKGGSQVCFQNPGSWYKFRLGNECETYGEAEFNQVLYKDKNGIEFVYDLMFGYATPGAGDFENLAGSGNHIALRQTWVGAKNLPFLGGAMAWAGKRYYMRNDVHMIDFFYWDVSGPGAGIQDIAIGPAKLAIAEFQAKVNDTKNIMKTDIRAYGIPVNPDGELQAGLDLWYTSDQTATQTANRQKLSPWVTVQHIQSNLMGGFNKVAVQYATGSAWNMSNSPAEGGQSKDKQFRVVEHLMIQPAKEFSGSLVVTYQNIKLANGSKGSLYGAGIRPQYHFNDFFMLQGELGWNQVKPSGASATSLFKATIAPTIVPAPGAGGAYFTRPELRLFATYASWNDTALAAGVANGVFGTNKNGLTVGAQVEAWW